MNHSLLLCRRTRLHLSVWILVVLAGCNDGTWPTTTTAATGSVTVNGEIPAGAIVRLYPPGTSADSQAGGPHGVVLSNGQYTLTTYDLGDGAPPGEYVFTLYWPVDLKQGDASPCRLNETYADPQTSELRVQVLTTRKTIDPVEISGADITQPAEAEQPAGQSTLKRETTP